MSAMTLRERYHNITPNVIDPPRWIADTHKFWYRKTVNGGHEFVLVDAESRARGPAFDHAKLAAALASALKGFRSAGDAWRRTFVGRRLRRSQAI